MDGWQEAALSNRHLHNRVGKHGRGKGGKSNGGFDVQKTLGTYEVKCPAAGKLADGKGSNTGVGRLEIYHLNDQGNALVGELLLPEVLHGSVILAANRKTLKMVVGALEEHEQDEVGTTGDGAGDVVQSHAESQSPSGDDDEGEEGGGGDAEYSCEEDRERQRYQQFEKNSFRSPKFWMKWQGQLLCPRQDSGQDQPENSEEPDRTAAAGSDIVTNTGYLIYSGNNCEKFQGTFSCKALEWDNVKLSGWKLKGHSARNFQVRWEPSAS